MLKEKRSSWILYILWGCLSIFFTHFSSVSAYF